MRTACVAAKRIKRKATRLNNAVAIEVFAPVRVDYLPL